MQITRQTLPDSQNPLLSEDKWVCAPTELRHATRMKQAFAASGVTDLTHQDLLVILSVLDGHGLFHEPIPVPKQPRKDIERAATAAANRLQRRIMGIRAGKIPATDAREQRLAEQWLRLGPAALKMEAENIRCATYQTLRGGRIVAIGAYAHRRPERELTHALLLIDCHLDHGKGWPTAKRIACLTTIVIVLQNLQVDAIIVAARVRDRLREAAKDASLQIWKSEYQDALRAVGIPTDVPDKLTRTQQFEELQAALYSPESSPSAMEEVAARIGPSFRGA
jgi:hypothetical protein